MLTANDGKIIDILLVEDSPSDALMTKEALNHQKVLNRLHIVDDGVEAMAFLRRQGKYSEAPRPGLILLDLNLPRKNGLEVLRDLKSDAELKAIPVVVLTTSKAEEDVLNSYEAHANCYITKPVEFTKLTQAVQSIREFWVCVVTLPPETR
ncbi:MAG TPA: response regulator [Terriglobales bacterium]|jgi:CheY-like chemotaxis protein|nr:response regulator [Terriglobales bacterium]